MSKQRRSVVWIVGTHVLTTGLAIPTVIGILGAAIMAYANLRDPLHVLYVRTTFAVLGYAGGTLYSLAYLSKTTECESWTRCTAPSIIAFTILGAAGFALEFRLLQERTPFSIAILSAGYLVGGVAFALLTSAGFKRMASVPRTLDDERETVRAPSQKNGLAEAFRKRLLAACVGFALGFAVGIGISIYMASGGSRSLNDWQTRISIGLVVGGICAILGFVSGTRVKMW